MGWQFSSTHKPDLLLCPVEDIPTAINTYHTQDLLTMWSLEWRTQLHIHGLTVHRAPTSIKHCAFSETILKSDSEQSHLCGCRAKQDEIQCRFSTSTCHTVQQKSSAHQDLMTKTEAGKIFLDEEDKGLHMLGHSISTCCMCVSMNWPSPSPINITKFLSKVGIPDACYSP